MTKAGPFPTLPLGCPLYRVVLFFRKSSAHRHQADQSGAEQLGCCGDGNGIKRRPILEKRIRDRWSISTICKEKYG